MFLSVPIDIKVIKGIAHAITNKNILICKKISPIGMVKQQKRTYQ
jgi:hypothetical protein